MSVPLSATQVTHRYGDVVALAGVSMEVVAGSVVAIVGESGSGKSTLIRCFNRMVEPEDGVIRVGADDVRTQDVLALRHRIGYVQQHGGLLPHWTVTDNVGLVLRSMGRDDPAAVTEALELAGIDGATYASRFPGELSGGQRQRVALARAMASRPQALILDEPFGALDAISRGEVQDSFSDAQKNLGVTMLLVTHDLAEAARLTDDIVVMRNGKIIQRGTMKVLRDSPATEYVEALIRSALRQLEPLLAGTGVT